MQLAWSSAETKYFTDWAKNTSVVKEDYYKNLKLLNSYISETGEIEETKENGNGSWTVRYRAKDQNYPYTFIIDESGSIRKKAEIVMDKESLELQIVDGVPTSEVLTATVEGINGTITWSVEGEESAKISLVESEDKRTATITGIEATTGTITVVAECGEGKAECTVTVISVVHVSSISDITPRNVTVDRGTNTQTITVVVNEGATERLTWTASNDHIMISEPELDKTNNTQTVTLSVLSSAISGEQITLTAQNSAENLTANNTVTLTINVPVTGIIISPSSLVKIYPNDNTSLIATVEPSDATNKTINWSIEEGSTEVIRLPSITSTTSGNSIEVTAGENPGIVTLRATASDGNCYGECAIEVKGLRVGSIVIYEPNGTYLWDKTRATSDETGNITLSSGVGGSCRITRWKVLSIDEVKEKVVLVPSTTTVESFKLRGRPGYANAITMLNEVCGDLYGSVEKEITARCIKLEDFTENKITFKGSELTGELSEFFLPNGTETNYWIAKQEPEYIAFRKQYYITCVREGKKGKYEMWYSDTLGRETKQWDWYGGTCCLFPIITVNRNQVVENLDGEYEIY